MKYILFIMIRKVELLKSVHVTGKRSSYSCFILQYQYVFNICTTCVNKVYNRSQRVIHYTKTNNLVY